MRRKTGEKWRGEKGRNGGRRRLSLGKGFGGWAWVDSPWSGSPAHVATTEHGLCNYPEQMFEGPSRKQLFLCYTSNDINAHPWPWRTAFRSLYLNYTTITTTWAYIIMKTGYNTRWFSSKQSSSTIHDCMYLHGATLMRTGYKSCMTQNLSLVTRYHTDKVRSP